MHAFACGAYSLASIVISTTTPNDGLINAGMCRTAKVGGHFKEIIMIASAVRGGVLALVLIASLGFVSIACNTTEGVGKDIESTGEALKDGARDSKN